MSCVLRRTLTDKLVEQHPGDHVQRLKDAFTLVRRRGERRDFTSRLFIRNSMYSAGAALGKSRLLNCKTYGISAKFSLSVRRFSSKFVKLSTFSCIFSYCESATNTMPSTPLSTSWRVVL